MLKNIKELASDSMIYGATTVLSQLISLVLVPFFSHELSPEEYGIIALVALIISFLEPIVGLGMDSALFRYFSKSNNVDDRKQYFSIAFIFKGLFVVLVVLLLLPFYETVNSILFSGALTRISYYVFLSTFLISNVTSVAFVILRADRMVKHVSLANLISLISGLFFSVYFVLFLNWGVEGALLGTLFGASAKALFFGYTIVKNLYLTRVNKSKLKELFTYGLPQVPHKIQARILSLFTIFMVNEHLGLAMAGLYAVAKKFSKPIGLVVSTVQTSWSPYKFQIHREEPNPRKLFGQIIPFYWILLICLWSVLSIVAPWLFKTLIDDRYHMAIPMIPFIMALPVLEAFRFTVSTGFELSDRQQKTVLASFLGLLAFVVLSLSFADFHPPYSFIVSQGIAYIVMGVVLYGEAKKVMIIQYPFKWTVLYYLCCVGTIFLFYQNISLLSFFYCLFVIVLLTLLIIHKLYTLSLFYRSVQRLLMKVKLRV